MKPIKYSGELLMGMADQVERFRVPGQSAMAAVHAVLYQYPGEAQSWVIAEIERRDRRAAGIPLP